ncbi:hypothetical protein LPJ55_005856 [Coemansia sp. RSA 990]|nr:hypothetical protein LPJ55_005856 [Coemansia sp. RSA 990]
MESVCDDSRKTAGELPRLNGFYYTQDAGPVLSASSSNLVDMCDHYHPTSLPSSASESPSAAHRHSGINTSIHSKLQQFHIEQQTQSDTLRRTSSQCSMNTTPVLGAGTLTPQPGQNQAGVFGLDLCQTGQVRCLQTLSQKQKQLGNEKEEESNSALSLALSDDYVFSGTQRGHICVWRRETFRLERVLYGHSAGCLALAVDSDHGVLFSGGGDGRVRAWDMQTLRCLYVVHAGVNSGAILSLAYSHKQQVLVLGCQNTSIQLFDVQNRDSVGREQRVKEMAARRSRFFDGSTDPIAVCASYMGDSRPASPADSAGPGGEVEENYVIFEQTITHYAHSGYVYSLLLGNVANDDDVLFSAASDGSIRMWQLHGMELREAGALECDGDGDACVHSLALDDGQLFAGLQSGDVEVWDVETRQRIRTLSTSTANAFSLAIHAHCVYVGSADGSICVWSGDLQPLGRIGSNGDAVLALVVENDGVLVSGGGNAVSFWDVAHVGSGVRLTESTQQKRVDNGQRRMLQALDQWIQFRSVSGVPEMQAECRRAARFFKDLAQQLGAVDARLISSMPESNPLVYARFDASSKPAQPLAEQPTVFVYGHYDVMPAGDVALWQSHPFELSGRDGYLYGRGVSDDKGPVLAALFAVADLAAAGQLPLTVVFCIEGEEEHGSVGLRETMDAHRALFGVPRLILLSLSYWLGETTPCLTYGMRGSIRASLQIESSRNADVHAGVWGGAVNEPLACLSHLLARLADSSGHVLVPGFYDDVRSVSDQEKADMRRLVHWVAQKELRAPLARALLSPTHSPSELSSADSQSELSSQLMQRWRFPTLTVHHMDVSTVAARSNATLVPAAAQASLSVRVVPDQSIDGIAASLRAHIESVFAEIQTQRRQAGPTLDELRLHLDVKPHAHWWLADPETPVYQAAAQAIRKVWADASDSKEETAHIPLLIREGGSIPAVPWLESFFAPHAVAVNLPMGQSSDNAHLDNERISLENLMRGRQIIHHLIQDFKIQ